MTTETSTVADTIREAFKYWGAVPPLTTYASIDELERRYRYQSGPNHWFDPETLRFFGSRNRHLVRPGVMCETQTKAPECVGRYAVWAWVVDMDQPYDHRSMGRISPQHLASFHSLTGARRFAVRVFDSWQEVTA